MSNYKGKQQEWNQKPEGIRQMDLFTYRKRIGTLDQTGLGKLNESGWLITNEDDSETWISEKQYKKLIEWNEWYNQ